jgi:hypothetical protein
MLHPVDLSELQNLELFAGLAPDLLKQLATASHFIDYEVDAGVFQEGDAFLWLLNPWQVGGR